MTHLELGFEVGEVCNRGRCKGVIEEKEVDGCCSCHNNPPCSYCTTPKECWYECGWDLEEENIQKEMEYRKTDSYKNMQEVWVKQAEEARERRELFYKKYQGKHPIDKLEIIYEGHTHFSVKYLGVFPEGTETKESLLPKVKGTFGGRFTSFTKYSFTYIAYTD